MIVVCTNYMGCKNRNRAFSEARLVSLARFLWKRNRVKIIALADTQVQSLTKAQSSNKLKLKKKRISYFFVLREIKFDYSSRFAWFLMEGYKNKNKIISIENRLLIQFFYVAKLCTVIRKKKLLSFVIVAVILLKWACAVAKAKDRRS